MKRSTIALAICMGLCACSGQRNEDIHGLNSGKRDAAADADRESDADGEDGEDTGGPREDASEPGSDAAGAGSDAGVQAGDASAGQDADGGTASDTGTVGDTGITADTGSGGADGGDVGGNPNELRIKVEFEVGSFLATPIVFNYADGGVQSMQTPNSEGVVVSAVAPASFTAVLPGNVGTLNDHYDMITVVAPALGDVIVLAPFIEQSGADQAVRYLANMGEPPASTYGMRAYAGVEGCSQGYADIAPPPMAPMEIGQRSDCQLETNGSAIAIAYDEPGEVLGYATTVLPPAGGTPVSIQLDQWVDPEIFSVLLNNTASGATTAGYLWMRKGALRVRADQPNNPPANAIPFPVARNIVDSFDGEGWFKSTMREHQFRKNRPASVANITHDFNDALPDVETVDTTLLPLLQPSASWTVKGGSTPADAVLAAFSWSWQPNADTTASLTWRIVAPPSTTSVLVPAYPTVGSSQLVSPDSDLDFQIVEYYESSTQGGYREFLKEPLRPGATLAGLRGLNTPDLLRDLPVGGSLRASRYLHFAR